MILIIVRNTQSCFININSRYYYSSYNYYINIVNTFTHYSSYNYYYRYYYSTNFIIIPFSNNILMKWLMIVDQEH